MYINNNKHRKEARRPESDKVRDVNSKEIFSNKKLLSQFLRGYSGLDIFRDTKPEDIEDVTERYKYLLGTEIEGDTINKVHIPAGISGEDIFVISLIEHKSRVDYDVAMQLLRYRTVIWSEYAKEKDAAKERSHRSKDFRYPVIIPVVYYEGASEWTAGLHLSDRIYHVKGAEKYIPDFTYRLVPIHEYSIKELEDHRDEMALILMINRIQDAEDMRSFLNEAEEYFKAIYSKAPEDIQQIIQSVLWGLMMKMNVPEDEAIKSIRKMEDKDMGILFADMEPMDIQKERANTARERQRADSEKLRADNEKLRADRAEQHIRELEEKIRKMSIEADT